MINFFRKIRQNQLLEGKTGKPATPAGGPALPAGRYFKYAIGEILLVVIGILIALQINKWNEAKIDRKTETQALINLKAEFDNNHERLEFIMTIKQKQEDRGRSFLEIISNGNIPISEKIKAKRPGTWNGNWGATNSVLNSLLSTGDITKIQNDSLKYLLTNWSVYVNRYEAQERKHTESSEKRSNYLVDKHYGSIVNQGDHSIKWPGNYYPNDIDEKNEKLVASYINELEYYNLTRRVIASTYILLINATTISENYEKISRLLKQELRNRNIDLSKSNLDR